ncbi:hypothetical protein ANANG_G00190760 [Anguilla anguilla]|uniref:Uncharacterized protein n=1 Tax=Anguilla anguilla TaxID=7936 RepID=A0A9D3RRU7_ANGAN|nr:hypothetical protein ANANG_G00190760 [Anguilla anguilla]
MECMGSGRPTRSKLKRLCSSCGWALWDAGIAKQQRRTRAKRLLGGTGNERQHGAPLPASGARRAPPPAPATGTRARDRPRPLWPPCRRRRRRTP